MFGLAGVICNSIDATCSQKIENIFLDFLSDSISNENVYVGEHFRGTHFLITFLKPKGIDNIQTSFSIFNDGISIAFYGNLFNDEIRTTGDILPFIHSKYITQGISCTKDLNGSFSLFINDSNRNISYICSDRVASVQTMYYAFDKFVLFSPDLRMLSKSKYVPNILDKAAIATKLSSNYIYDDKTYIKGVKYLKGAEYLELTKEKIHQNKYWDQNNFRTSLKYKEKETECLAEELSDLMLKAVERRINRCSSPVLFLSGGIDSRAILGACLELGKKITLVSYYNEAKTHVTDYHIARFLSELTGMPFVSLYFDSPLKSLEKLKETTLYFGGMRNWIYEYEAFQKMKGLAADFTFWGDEAYGWKDVLLNNEEDVFRSIGISKFYNQPVWKKLLRPNLYKEMGDLSEEFYSNVSSKCKLINLHERKDYFYVTERLARNIIPVKNLLLKNSVILNPWLDNEILDFTSQLPPEHRLDKSLFRYTCNKLFADLFNIPLADTNAQLSIDRNRLFFEFSNIIKNNPQEIFENLGLIGEKYAIDDLIDQTELNNVLFSKPIFRKRMSRIMNKFIIESESQLIGRFTVPFNRILNKNILGSNIKKDSLNSLDIFERIVILRYIVGQQLKLEL